MKKCRKTLKHDEDNDDTCDDNVMLMTVTKLMKKQLLKLKGLCFKAQLKYLSNVS